MVVGRGRHRHGALRPRRRSAGQRRPRRGGGGRGGHRRGRRGRGDGGRSADRRSGVLVWDASFHGGRVGPTGPTRLRAARRRGLAPRAAGPRRPSRSGAEASGTISSAPQRRSAAPGRLPFSIVVLRTPLSLWDCVVLHPRGRALRSADPPLPGTVRGRLLQPTLAMRPTTALSTIKAKRPLKTAAAGQRLDRARPENQTRAGPGPATGRFGRPSRSRAAGTGPTELRGRRRPRALAVVTSATLRGLNPFDLGNCRTDQRNPRWFVEGSPVGNRGQEGRVGLDQEPVPAGTGRPPGGRRRRS